MKIAFMKWLNQKVSKDKVFTSIPIFYTKLAETMV